MKKLFPYPSLLIALIFTMMSCGGEDDTRLINNPYLNPIPVSLNLNLNLPQYNLLKYPGNFVTQQSRRRWCCRL